MKSWLDSGRIGTSATAIVLGALLLWLGAGMEPIWPLTWLAPMPVLLVAIRASARRTALVAFGAWFIGMFNMWSYLHGLIEMPLADLLINFSGMGLVFAIAVLLFRVLLHRGAYVSALLALPATWVSFEYIANLVSSSGTAISLAYTQLRFLPFLQLASLTGPWGMSFLLLSFSPAVVIGVYLYGNAPNPFSHTKPTAQRPRDGEVSEMGIRRAIWIVGADIAVIAAVLIFGTVRLMSPMGGPSLRVGLVASDAPGNDDLISKGSPTRHLLQAYADEVAKLATNGAKVVVMPEKLGTVADGESSVSDAVLQATADRSGSVLVAGLDHMATNAEYNAARVYTPHAVPLEYHKEHLLLPFEQKFTPGKAITLLSQKTGMWGIAICKDMDFTGLSRSYGKAGVGLLLVPAWDFDVDWIYHGHIALMRGVENGFSIVRAAKHGSLYVSDNRGRVLAEVRTDTAPFVTLVTDLPVGHADTLYQRFGNWFAWVTLALLLWVIMRALQLRKQPFDR